MKLLLKLKRLLFIGALQKRKARRHLKHLEYAYSQLSSSNSGHSMEYEDKHHKLAAIAWLISYYLDVINGEVVMRTPKTELLRIYRLKSKESGPREHVFAGVLYNWIEHKRIDCY